MVYNNNITQCENFYGSIAITQIQKVPPYILAWTPTASQYLALKHAEMAHYSAAQAEHDEIAQYYDYDTYR